MHFGLLTNSFTKISVTLLLCCGVLTGCRDKAERSLSFQEPSQGQNLNAGQRFKIKLDIENASEIDSVLYLIDGKIVARRANADSVWIRTKDLQVGYRIISAIVAQGKKLDTLTTNVVLKASAPPTQINYKIVRAFPHNTQSYTEGLSYVDGQLLESTGEKGSSALKYVDLNTGKDIKRVKIDPQYFGEGSLKIGNKIIMLTWQENVGLIFDAKTLQQLGTFPYQMSREGWGLTYDGKNILRSDGTNRIWRMNATTYREEGYVEVYDHNGPVEGLNELEYIDGKIYANVYPSSNMVRIDPSTGAVEAIIDLSALLPKNFFKTDHEVQNNVLNGIAWDKKGRRLFVVGKKWPTLFEIRLENHF